MPLFAWVAGSLRGMHRADNPVGVVEALRLLALVVAAAIAGATVWILVARHLLDFADVGITPMLTYDEIVEWRWALGGAFVTAVIIGLRDYSRRA